MGVHTSGAEEKLAVLGVWSTEPASGDLVERRSARGGLGVSEMLQQARQGAPPNCEMRGASICLRRAQTLHFRKSLGGQTGTFQRSGLELSPQKVARKRERLERGGEDEKSHVPLFFF